VVSWGGKKGRKCDNIRDKKAQRISKINERKD